MVREPLLPLNTDTPSTFHPPVNPLLFVVALLVLLLVGSSALAFNFYRQSQGLPTPTLFPSPVLPTPTLALPTLMPTVLPTPTATSSTTITWISPPKHISALDIFQSNNPDSAYGYSPAKAKFYQVATLSKGEKLIVVYVPTQGMGEYNTLVRLVSDNDHYFLVTSNPNDAGNLSDLIDSQKVGIWPYQIADLQPPEYLYTKNNNNGNYKKLYPATESFDTLTNPILLEDFPSGSLYYTKNPVSSQPVGVFGLNFYFRLKDNNYYGYNPIVPSFSDNQVPNITWSDSSVNSTAFNTRLVMGCGLGSASSNYALSSELVSSKVHAGFIYNQIQPENEVFQITDPNNPLVKSLYTNYKVGRESEPGLLSLNDFAAKHNHFIWKDKLGNYLLFISTEYQTMAECGKPVIYLYPLKPTQVSVKVSAHITQSEPLYPASGWQVLASPKGQLIYQDQTYPYLYWEGQGEGIYPDYRNQGTLVTQSDLIPTLVSQLHQLGLNDRETSDFLDFWQPRLPSTPYIRLTWLNTADMNRLAPLKVSPSPDTVIRLFLEFEGYQEPVSLQPQNLSAPTRHGFALIEWGGLLIK